MHSGTNENRNDYFNGNDEPANSSQLNNFHICKKSLKIPKRQPETSNRKNVNKMAKTYMQQTATKKTKLTILSNSNLPINQG